MSTVSSYWARLATLGRDRVAWRGESFTEPSTRWVAADGEPTRRTALTTTTPVDLSDYVVTREFVTSWDGTRVPLNVIAARDTPRDGTAPALLTATAAKHLARPELHHGDDPVAGAGRGVRGRDIRGGGVYGQEWHQAGRLGTKQNCFDDFIACADHLVESGITRRTGSRSKAVERRPADGRRDQQRPDLARACIAAVPVMDSLRSETTMNGRYNTTEYGTVDDPEHFKARRTTRRTTTSATGWPTRRCC